MKKWFSEHPASVGESYLEHCGHAAGFGVAMVAGGLACLVHAVLPFLFVKTGSGVIARLHDRMVVNRHARSARPTRRRADSAGPRSAQGSPLA